MCIGGKISARVKLTETPSVATEQDKQGFHDAKRLVFLVKQTEESFVDATGALKVPDKVKAITHFQIGSSYLVKSNLKH